MRLQILDKLEVELNKQIVSEAQVVYILSKIRKLLEWENARSSYKTLNFYCNWVLHNKIDRTEPVSEILKDFVEKKENRYKLIFHEAFKKEFNGFLTNYSLPKLSSAELDRFIDELNNCISETPIEVMIGTKYRIKLRDPESDSLFYEIVPLVSNS